MGTIRLALDKAESHLGLTGWGRGIWSGAVVASHFNCGGRTCVGKQIIALFKEQCFDLLLGR
jgi:hypothetical protein